MFRLVLKNLLQNDKNVWTPRTLLNRPTVFFIHHIIFLQSCLFLSSSKVSSRMFTSLSMYLYRLLAELNHTLTDICTITIRRRTLSFSSFLCWCLDMGEKKKHLCIPPLVFFSFSNKHLNQLCFICTNQTFSFRKDSMSTLIRSVYVIINRLSVAHYTTSKRSKETVLFPFCLLSILSNTVHIQNQ